MAEMMKSTGSTGNSTSSMDDIKSRVQSTVGNVSDRVSDVTHNVVDRFGFSGNRSVLTYVGIGVLLVGAGFGLWSLLRSREDDISSDAGYGASYGRDDYRRTQY